MLKPWVYLKFLSHPKSPPSHGPMGHGFPWWESLHFSIPKNRRNGNWTKLCKNHYLDQTCTAEDQALFFSRSGSGIQTGLCFWFGSCISGISQELLNLTSICAKEHWFGSKPLAGTRMQEVQCMQQESCTVKCKGKGAQSLYATDLVPAPSPHGRAKVHTLHRPLWRGMSKKNRICWSGIRNGRQRHSAEPCPGWAGKFLRSLDNDRLDPKCQQAFDQRFGLPSPPGRELILIK